MKHLQTFIAFAILAASIITVSCSSEGGSKSSGIDLSGLDESILTAPVNETLAMKGQQLYAAKCIACHQLDQRQVGPPLRDVVERRSLKWLVQMIEDAESFVKTDPEAKKVYEEYNRMPMVIPGGITRDETLAVVEYLKLVNQE